ncbi:MAG: IclR family transcriptional regulator [Coraliomargaritaceae bacterium]
MPVNSENSYRAPALEKGLDILEFLSSQGSACTKSQIAEALDKSPSEIYRMLTVLEERGYLRKQPGTQAYFVSLKLYQLCNQQDNFRTLRSASRLPMEHLANRIGEACHLSIAQGDVLLVMMERMPAQSICLAVGEGTSVPLSQTSSGRIFLSLMEPLQREKTLVEESNFQSFSAKEQKIFLDHLDVVRDQGYEIARSQVTANVIDVTLPVGVVGTDISGVLAVSQISNDLKSPKLKQTLEEMQLCVQEIHQNLGI